MANWNATMRGTWHCMGTADRSINCINERCYRSAQKSKTESLFMASCLLGVDVLIRNGRGSGGGGEEKELSPQSLSSFVEPQIRTHHSLPPARYTAILCLCHLVGVQLFSMSSAAAVYTLRVPPTPLALGWWQVV